MRKSILGLVAVAALIASPAMAADLRMPVKAPPAPLPPPCVWCGWYIGVNVGGAWGNDTDTYNQTGTPFSASATLHPSGVIGGGQIGYNWQFNNIVLGIEGDFDGQHNTATANGLLPFPGNTIDRVNISQTDNWLSTVRGRLGVAFGNVLFYGTGGAAFGDVAHSYTQIRTTTGQALTLSDDDTRTGWTAGAGIEWMVWNNVSLGVEYLHVDLGNTTLVQGSAVTVAGLTFPPSSTSFQNRQDIVRAKWNWHFNFGGAPVATRY